MNLFGPHTVITAPTAWPVSTGEAFAQCRHGGDEAEMDTAWFVRAIKAATDHCERNIPGGRQLMTATLDLPVRQWWWGCPLKVTVKPPLQSVTSVKYYDADGDLTTVSSALYVVRAPTDMPGEIELLPNQDWPGDYDARTYPVVLRVVAGYASASAVPEIARHAILIKVADWFDNRTPIGSSSRDVDECVQGMLNSLEWGCYA